MCLVLIGQFLGTFILSIMAFVDIHQGKKYRIILIPRIKSKKRLLFDRNIILDQLIKNAVVVRYLLIKYDGYHTM